MSKLKYIIAVVVGIVVGYLFSLYGKISAIADIKVRPELANVDFWTALLADHPQAYLFYHYPDIMTVASIAFGMVAAVLFVAFRE
jgi:hypothetical protein